MVRPSILIGLTLVALAAPLDAQDLSKPETIVWDSAHSRYLVSNWNTGDIVQIDLDGSYTLFSDGVQSAAGMHIIGDSLFVASNFTAQQGIAIFSLTTAQQIGYFKPTGMQFANSICSDTSGYLYVSDTQTNRIYRVLLPTGVSSTLCNSITLPNGIFFDRRNNRLLVASNASGSPLWEVSTSTGAVSAATTFAGEFDGMDEDNMHNLYVSWSGAGLVYRFDSTLAGTPTLLRSGHNQPEGICFNRQHSVLGIPNMFAHTVALIPYDVDVWAEIDTSTGWVPLDVTFKGRSAYAGVSYEWDFGDGETATGDSIVHRYDDGGNFDVTVRAITPSGDTATRIYPRQIVALADSVWADSTVIDTHTGKVAITISGRFSTALRELTIPVTYAGSLSLLLDSVSLAGCLTSFFDTVYEQHANPSARQSTYRLIAREYGAPLYIAANRGPVLRLYFQTVFPEDSQSATITLDEYYTQYPLRFIGKSMTYVPRTKNGAVIIPPCCSTVTGNVNNSGIVDLADLSALVSYLTGGGYEPSCPESANVNAVGIIDLADLSALVSYLTGGGYLLPTCP